MRKTTYAYYFEIDGRKATMKLDEYIRGRRGALCEDKMYRSLPFFICKKINEDLAMRAKLRTPFLYYPLKWNKDVLEKAVIFIERKKNKAITCMYENGLFSLENTNDLTLNKHDRECFKRASITIFVDDMIKCTDIDFFSIKEERKTNKAVITVDNYLKPILKDLSGSGYILKIPSGDVIISDEEFCLEDLENAWKEDEAYYECDGMYCRFVHREIADLLPIKEKEMIDFDELESRLKNG